MTHREPPGPPQPEVGFLRTASGVARLAAASWWHLAGLSVDAGISGTNYVLRRVLAGEPAPAILQGASADLRAAAWRALGLRDPSDDRGVPQRIQPRDSTAAELRRRGKELIRRSNDVNVTDDTHPAFARILAEITPDEARILRFLYLDGPQPAIDVRTNRPLGIGSELVAGGLSLIAEHSGCANVGRIHPYLTNLARLGLVDFSKEQVRNPKRYQVIEAQPKVAEAIARAGRMPRIVQRSIRLNEFGRDFVRTCLPVDDARRPAGGEPTP